METTACPLGVRINWVPINFNDFICCIPCKIGTGISPASRQDYWCSPGSHRDPAKKKTLLQDPGENPAEKQNLDSIRGENLILAE